MTKLSPPIKRGRTADIHAWRAETLLKLYHADFSREDVAQEVEFTRRAQAVGVPVAEITDLVNVDERYGLVLRHIPGPTLLEALTAPEASTTRLACLLAELQSKIHQCLVPELPSLREKLSTLIRRAVGVSGGLIETALASLRRLPDDTRLCHGDFHPLNIILAAEGPVVLDWYKASAGHPAADVTRTVMVLDLIPPAGMGSSSREHLERRRSEFSAAYRKRYAELQPRIIEQIDLWRLPVAVARLATDISANERAALLQMLAGSR